MSTVRSAQIDRGQRSVAAARRVSAAGEANPRLVSPSFVGGVAGQGSWAAGGTRGGELVLDSGPLDPTGHESVAAVVVAEHLDELLERVSTEAGRSLPDFVVRELRAMTGCGDFARGFARLRCADCRADRIVPFSCRTRLCSSCAARRMSDTAAWLVDRVLI